MNVVELLVPVLALLLPPAAPKFTAELRAADDTVPPGGKTELAITLTVEKGWHIYHPIILDTGAPTTVAFEAPPGVTFGELRFPTPELEEEGDAKFLSLTGRVVVLTTIEITKEAPPSPVKIQTLVHALVCKGLCVPVDATAVLTLKVGPQTAASANADFFKEAHDALPAPLAQAKYIEGSSVAVLRDIVGIDEENEVVLTIKVRKGHHIQDRDPGVEGLIPARLYIEPLDGLRFDEQKWPAAHVREMEDFGKVREQSGEFKIRAPFTVIDSEFAGGPIALRVLFTYQCCTDAGTCYPPETADAVVQFRVHGATEPPADARPRGTVFAAIFPPGGLPVAATPAPLGTSATRTQPDAGVLWNLLLGFLGGLILNVMPCVFPVISIKIIGFVKQAGEDRGRIFRLGLAFCAGIMVWFWVFGILTARGQIPWQNPWVVISLASILFLFALNLFGVFEIVLPGTAASTLDAAAGREGYTGAFLKGLLATLMGTACTAPFFASAATYAATQGQVVALVVFSGAGLGMASPYVLLSAYPGWLRFLPKPGAWMVTFKQAMGFVLLGTAVWLLLIIARMLDARGVAWTTAFLTFLGLAAWLVGKIGLNWTTRSRVLAWAHALAIVALGIWFCFFFMYDVQKAAQATPASEGKGIAEAHGPDEVLAAVAASDWNGHIPWQTWRPGLDEELARRGYTVYVDFTAGWCVTCLTNKATTLEIDSMRAKMKSLGVIPLEGDYTNPDPEIRSRLLAFGRNSVPLNQIFPAGLPANVITLPYVLTPGIVTESLDQAGPSKTRGAPAATDR
jgi:thiol:disulfide interchange protein DsbD